MTETSVRMSDDQDPQLNAFPRCPARSADCAIFIRTRVREDLPIDPGTFGNSPAHQPKLDRELQGEKCPEVGGNKAENDLKLDRELQGGAGLSCRRQQQSGDEGGFRCMLLSVETKKAMHEVRHRLVHSVEGVPWHSSRSIQR